MAKKIFVGNLSFQTTENDLSDLFAQFGEVESVSIITDRDTGRSKGFGFVAMNDDNAEKAISQLNGTELNGRALTVSSTMPAQVVGFRPDWSRCDHAPLPGRISPADSSRTVQNFQRSAPGAAPYPQ